MFRRSTTPLEGFTKYQQRMLAQYVALRTKAMNGRLTDGELLRMGERPPHEVLNLAIALDRYGTPAQREMFIEAERAVIDRIIGTGNDQLPLAVLTILADEAKAAWPSVRLFETFAAMEHSMRANGYEADVFETASFIGPVSATARIVWLSAYGGPKPISWMDTHKTMGCVQAFNWMQGAKDRLEIRVNELLKERSNRATER